MRNQSPGTLSWIILCTLSMVWGASFFLMKKGLVAFQPEQVGALRICFSFLVLAPVLLFRFRKLQRESLPWIFLAALFGNGLPPFLFTYGLLQLDSGFEGILNSLTPLFTLAVGVLFFKTKVRWQQAIGIATGLAGAAVLIVMHTPFELAAMQYALAVVAATICYGISANLIKSKLQTADPLAMSAAVFSMLAPLAAAVLFSTDFTLRSMQSREAQVALLHIAVLAVFGTALSLVAFNYLIQKTNPLWASTVTYLIPVVSLMIGVADGESFRLLYVPAMLVILLGVYLAR
jgi:drug/metabolite transporter (DMT)-like permease